jgi:hypothetical protein
MYFGFPSPTITTAESCHATGHIGERKHDPCPESIVIATPIIANGQPRRFENLRRQPLGPQLINNILHPACSGSGAYPNR